MPLQGEDLVQNERLGVAGELLEYVTNVHGEMPQRAVARTDDEA